MTNKISVPFEPVKKREIFMVRLRKDRKDIILNEKRRKLYNHCETQHRQNSFTLSDVVIDSSIEVIFDKDSRRCHLYRICPLF